MKRWVVTLYCVATYRGVESETVKGLTFSYEIIDGEFIIDDDVKNAFPIENFVTREYKQSLN